MKILVIGVEAKGVDHSPHGEIGIVGLAGGIARNVA